MSPFPLQLRLRRFVVLQKGRYRCIDPAVGANSASSSEAKAPIPRVADVTAQAHAFLLATDDILERNPVSKADWMSLESDFRQLCEEFIAGEAPDFCVAPNIRADDVVNQRVAPPPPDSDVIQSDPSFDASIVLVDAHCAYKNCPIAPDHQRFNNLAVYDVALGTFVAFIARTAIFGDVHSVNSWLLISTWVAATFSSLARVNSRVYRSVIFSLCRLGFPFPLCDPLWFPGPPPHPTRYHPVPHIHRQ
jgi:hypothetical protein